MKQFLIGGLIGGSMVLGAAVLMGSTFNRGSEEPTYVDTGNISVPAKGNIAKTVSCPAGQYAIGFGFHTVLPGLNLMIAMPKTDRKNWDFDFDNPTANSRVFKAWVICL